MKSKRLIYILLLVVVGVGATLFVVVQRGVPPTKQTQAEQIAEQIILSYIEAKGLDIHPGTEEYASLMKGILLGEHPDLTGEDSIFVTSEIERDYVIDYAAAHMNLEAEKYIGGFEEPDIKEVEPISSEREQKSRTAFSGALAKRVKYNAPGNAPRRPNEKTD